MGQANLNVAKNTSLFTTALIIQKIIAFVYFTYLARLLGAERIGQYVFVLSYITIFSVISNLGTNHFITREVAKDNTQTQKITSNIFGFKLISSIVAVVAGVLFSYLMNYDLVLIKLLYIAMLIMVIESFVLSVYSLIRGFQNLKYESITTVLVQIIILSFGIGVALTTQNVWWLLIVLVLAHGSNLIYGLWVLKNKFLVKLKFSFDIKYWKNIYLVIVPFALAAFFSKVWGAFDQVLLAKLADPTELGYYGVAYKLTFALQFLPLALIASLYPAMSRYYVENKTKLSELFARAVNYLLFLTLPLIGAIFVFGQPLIKTLYTDEFMPAVWPMQILFLSLPFMFVNFPLGSLLNACNLQKRQSINIGVAMLVNIFLNLILIPKYYAAGAAWAALVSNFVYFTMGWQAISKVIKYDYKQNLLIFMKIATAALAITVLAFWLIPYSNWLILAIFSVIFYFILIYFFSTFSQSEIKQFLSSFKK